MKVNRIIAIALGFALILGGLLAMYLTKDKVYENILAQPNNFIFQHRTLYHELYDYDWHNK